MKQLVIALLLLFNLTGQAAIFRVNPESNSGAQFADLQSAINNPIVLDGDSIYLESNEALVGIGVVGPYTATSTKRVNLFGAGYFLNELQPDNEDLNVSLCSSLTFLPGSEGSTLFGLDIDALNISADGVIVEGCKVSNVSFNNVNGGEVQSCFLKGTTIGIPTLALSNCSNIAIKNSILLHESAATSGQNVVLESLSLDSEYDHCVFQGANSQIMDAFVHNCIFNSHTFDEIAGSIFQFNLFDFGTEAVANFNPSGQPIDPTPIDGTPSNQTDVDVELVFVGSVAPTEDLSFDIQLGSPADSGGDDGLNIGAYTGSPGTYIPGGKAGTPLVVDLNQAVATNTYLLPVTYSALNTDGITPIIHAEYFVDNDPGFGAANAINITTPAVFLNDQFFTVDLQFETEGFHVLGVRVLDAAGVWSPVQFDEFEKEGLQPLFDFNSLAFDISPGGDFAAAIPIDNPNDGSTEDFLTFFVDMAELEEGVHSMRIRAYDDGGAESTTYHQPLLVLPDPQPDPNLSEFEYFLDFDPGFGQAQSIPIPAGGDLFDGTIDMLIDEPNLGPHQLWIRVKDEDGAWSVAQVREIYIVDEIFEAADINNDCSVDVIDLLLLLQQWGCVDDGTGNPCLGDTNGDGNTDVGDLLLWLAVYGETCETMFPAGG